ncbi:MAG: ABC transporter substrate-binding protein [Ruthenibacterium sp.]
MKKFVSMMVVMCLAISMAACGTAKTTTSTASNAAGSTAKSTAAKAGSSADGAIKIGGIGPLTGGAAVYGNAVKNGAELAVKEINAAGGLQYELNFQDDEHDAEKAINAYNNLKDWGLQVLMGTVTSTPCIAVAEESHNDNIFQLTPSGSAVDCVKYDNAFRVCFSDPNQGAASAQYIGTNKLAKKIAVIYDSSDVYSSGIYSKFASEAANQGLEIVSAEAFTADSKTDFSVQLQKAKTAGAELVFLPIYYTEASLILTQANKLGYAPMFFGCDGLDGILTVDNLDMKLTENVMLLTPFAADAKDEMTQKFVADYQAAYKEMPNQFAADAYDAMYAISVACDKGAITADMDASAMCDALKSTFPTISIDGLTGAKMTWSPEGEPNKAPKAVKIANGVYTAM